jgi:pimeloyl-ACP methyl ester carboxylesterase
VSTIVLADFRTLAYEVLGDPQGDPIVVLHGTPGSWRQLACLDKPARRHGVALIAPDRAGYGESTHDPKRTIESGARDVGQLIDHLELQPCPIVGISGGGPTALACGIHFADRVTAVATVGGVGPMEPRDPRLPADRLITKVARYSEFATRLLLAAGLRSARRPEKLLDKMSALVARSDAELLLHDIDVRSAFLDDLRHRSSSTARAAGRDFWLFSHRWEVDLGVLDLPVHIWHGTDDRNVPAIHAQVLAEQCPTSQLHLVEGAGHILFAELDEILASIRPT